MCQQLWRAASKVGVAVVVSVVMLGVPLWRGDKKEGEQKGGTSSFVFLASPRRVAHLGFVCHDLARGGGLSCGGVRRSNL